MTTTTSAAAPVDAWTIIYTAAGNVSGYVQPAPGGVSILLRIGASVATNDAATAAAETINPGERVPVSLATGDKIMVRPVGPTATSVALRF